MAETIKNNNACYYEGDKKMFQEGQMVMYEGKEATIVRTNPLYVLKTDSGVIMCGDPQRLISFKNT